MGEDTLLVTSDPCSIDSDNDVFTIVFCNIFFDFEYKTQGALQKVKFINFDTKPRELQQPGHRVIAF